MAEFKFKARNAQGGEEQGLLTAESRKAIAEMLDRRGWFPISIESAGSTKAVGGSSNDRWSRRERTSFFRQLSDLLSAGVPLEKGLQSIAGQLEDRPSGHVAKSILGEVQGGSALHEAMRAFPKIFDTSAIELVRAGEAGGFLDLALTRVADFAEEEAALRSKIVTSLAYPMIVLVLGTAAVAFLLVYFVPQFGEIYADMGGELPAITQVLVGFSSFLRGNLLYILAVVGVLGTFIALRLQTPEGRVAFDYVKLRIPILKGLVSKTAIARFSRSLGLLLQSGVPILKALEIAVKGCGNLHFEQRLEPVAERVGEGIALARALSQTELIPRHAVDMAATGEESGTLDKVLIRISQAFEREVNESLQLLVTSLEILALVFVGSVVGFVVVAMLLPVFTLNTLVH